MKAVDPTRRLVQSDSVQRFVLVNGVLSEHGLVSVDASDGSLNLGIGIFETLRTYGGEVFAMDEHLDRLCASAFAIGLDEPNLVAIERELEVAAAAFQEDSMLRVTVTEGGTRVVVAKPLPPIPNPFRCVTRLFVPPPWLDGTVKHISRAFSRRAVQASGVEEVLWVDESGFLLEGTRSNVFAVVDGAFVTPPVDGRILAGVTRSALIEAADDAGIPVEIRPIRSDAPMEELYVSSTLKELTGVDELNGDTAPGAGPAGRMILNSFRRLVG